MEHSLNLSSSVGKEGVCSITANENTCYPEEEEGESGWTSYFQDLSQGMMEQSYSSSLDADGGSSLVSDAASCAAWKFSYQNNYSNNNNNHLVSCSSIRKSPNLSKNLCFKKSRAKQISDDDPLEDTASSPVNSPKVGDLMNNPTETISRKIDDQLDDSKGKRYKSGHYSEFQTNEENLNNGKNNTDCSDLKKRGLCLVPLSMFVNYFG